MAEGIFITLSSYRERIIEIADVKSRIRDAFDMIARKRSPHAFAVGKNEQRMIDHAEEKGITLGSEELYYTAKALSHPVRDSKQEVGLALPKEDYVNFPSQRAGMRLYWDSEGGGAYVYTDFKKKFIVKPNQEIKVRDANGKRSKIKSVCLITGGKVTDKSEFNKTNYERVYRKRKR